MDKKNTLLFVLFAGLVLFGSMFLGEYLWPRKDRPKAHPPVAQGQNPAKGQEKKAAPEKPAPEKPAPEKPAPPPVVEKPAPPARKITPEMLQLVQLGTPGGHLQATLDPRARGFGSSSPTTSRKPTPWAGRSGWTKPTRRRNRWS